MLDIQYRMHPSISQFPSLEFYNLSLRDGTVDALGNISPNLLPPLSSHLPVDELTGHQMSVAFLDHGGSETAKDRSRVNWNEAHIVCSIVEDLLLKNEVRLPSIAPEWSVLIGVGEVSSWRRRWHHCPLRCSSFVVDAPP